MVPPPDPPMAVMDAECGLCNRGARLLHRLDRSGEIRIVPIQSPRGQRLLLDHGLDPDNPDTWLLIEDGRVWRDLDAVIRLGERSGGPGYLLSLFRLVPGPLRRRIYAWLARNRLRFFGKGDLCALPDPALRARILQ